MDIEVITQPDEQDWRKIMAPLVMKLQLRILHDALDPVIEACIKSAISICDYDVSEIRRCLLPRTFRFYRTCWPKLIGDDGYYVIRLPFPPCLSVTSVTYLDANNAPQTLATSKYIVRKSEVIPAEIVFTSYDTLPELAEHPRAVAVEFTAGYGTTASPKVPEAMKQLISLYAGHFFENPEGTVNEPRIMMMNRSIDYGIKYLTGLLQIPHEYRDWE